MSEAFTELLRIRVTPSQMSLLANGAAASGSKNLSEFARRVLFQGLDINDELSAIRRLIIDFCDAGDNKSSASTHTTDPCALESLLLLRAITQPAQLRSIHSEMLRCGFPPVDLTDGHISR